MMLQRALPNPQIDLPLAADATQRFLPRIIAFMTYLAAIALAVIALFSAAGSGWRASLSGSLTVEVRPLATDAGEAGLERRTEAALAFLRAQPGIASAEPIAAERLTTLLEPWLGRTGGTGDLTLPRLIDVSRAEDAALDTAALATRLAEVVPGARLDDHRDWLQRLRGLVAVIEIVVLGVIVLIAAATAVTVVFTTRTGLAIHRDEIELLHLLGADDSYVARQFARQAGVAALIGALAGLALALATFVALRFVIGPAELAILPAIAPAVGDALLVIALPVAVVAVSAGTAYITVLRTLARIL